VDNAVSLVQAYLRLNGYFTVTEFPVLAKLGTDVRTVTDLDVLAIRFGGAIPLGQGNASPRAELDTALGGDPLHPDMIIGEVKEGRGRFNPSTLRREVVEAALVRFGCCDAAAAPEHVQSLLHDGSAPLPSGHRLRLVVFGAAKDADASPAHLVSLGHVVSFLKGFVDENWSLLRHTDSKDPAFSFLVTLEKALRDSPDASTKAMGASS
jgi:hypothetical protein